MLWVFTFGSKGPQDIQKLLPEVLFNLEKYAPVSIKGLRAVDEHVKGTSKLQTPGRHSHQDVSTVANDEFDNGSPSDPRIPKKNNLLLLKVPTLVAIKYDACD